MIDLRRARQEKGLTQKALAEAVGAVRQTISNIECGINLPSVELAKKIANVLDIDWVEFFAEEGDKK